MSVSESSKALNSSSLLTIRFNGKDFAIWKIKMLAYFEAFDLIEVVENPVSEEVPKTRMSFGSAPKVPVKKDKEKDKSSIEEKRENESQEKKSKKAYAILMLSLQTEQIRLVAHVPRGNANGVWEVLLQRYERKTTASKTHTRDMLHKCKMNKEEEFDDYLARINSLMLKLEEMEESVSKGELMYVLLNGLPESYSSIVQTLKVNDKMEYEEACEHIRDYQETLMYKNENNEIGKSENEVANHVGEKRKCFTCNKEGHMAYQCKRNKDKKKCYICKKIGHTEKECYRNKESKNNESDSESDQEKYKKKSNKEKCNIVSEQQVFDSDDESD
jgi:hypothetical protein